MPRHFYRELPRAPGTGTPRIRELATAALAARQGVLDLPGLEDAVTGAQAQTPLSLGELWALPAMLRLAVVEELAAAGRLLLDADPAAGEQDSRVTRAILALRFLATADWRAFVERVSVVERSLRDDPAGVYPAMDFATRDQYRKAVEEVARRDPALESRAAAEAVAMAREAGASGDGRDHVGFYLVGAGRPAFERRLAVRPRRRIRLRRSFARHPTLVYLGAIGAVAAGLLAAALAYGAARGATTAQAVALGLISLVPAASIAVQAINRWVVATLRPRALPKLDFADGIPPECRTLVVFPVLLNRPEEIESLLRGLEVNMLANEDPQLAFALLTDYGDAPLREMPGDHDLLEQATAGIEELNRRHGAGEHRPFLLCHRERLYNPAQGCWMGWERKRGKLVELNRLLRGGASSFTHIVGDAGRLEGVRFVLTLDGDTFLPREAAARLIGTLAHPLNQARFDPTGERVVSGYTVLQPRLEISPRSAERSRFARLFAAAVGLDLYSRAVSDAYQDLFCTGLYAGKGLYDVDAFRASLRGKVPDNALLSHDLFEGIQGRAALVSDVTLLEDHPSHVLTYLDRHHRWVRGDWQLLPWLLPRAPAESGWRRNRLAAIDRWKILDNLRRSLLAPAVVALLAAGWLWLPGSAAVWTAAALGALAAQPAFDALATLPRLAGGAGWRVVVPEAAARLSTSGGRAVVELAVLPVEAGVVLDAVGRTLVRLLVTRRQLLEWTTAAHAARRLGASPGALLVWRRLAVAPLAAAAALALVLAAGRTAALPWAAAVSLLWAVAPQLAHWLSRPSTVRTDPLVWAARRRLRLLARRTWLFFERFTGPDDQWLPPDNWQEVPDGRLARRTSPTNVGLYLLSSIAAYDLGYLDAPHLAARLRSTLDTLERMERYRGHFLNWYSTESLAPLEPRYVSTVDSGNLAACLLTVARACRQLRRAPLLRPAQLDGAADAAALLGDALARARIDDPQVSAPARDVERRVADLEVALRQAGADAPGEPARSADPRSTQLADLEQRLVGLAEAGVHVLGSGLIGELRTWLDRLHAALDKRERLFAGFLPWLGPSLAPPRRSREEPAAGDLAAMAAKVGGSLPGAAATLEELPGRCAAARVELRRLEAALGDGSGEGARELRRWCEELGPALAGSAAAAMKLIAELEELERRADAFAGAMDFRFLFDERRMLFRLGYDASAGEMDRNHYDLLASEARIASFLAIAKGDVESQHWLHLGRPFGPMDGTRGLLSWSGTAFEYLMPNLLLLAPEGTPLAVSCRAALRQQMSFARRHGVPWGMSESAFSRLGANDQYQYRAFGVPGTGVRRDLGDRLVIAPYASLLALDLEPTRVLRNLRELEELGLLGHFGFYEAVDFGSPQETRPRRPHRVRAYMSHHQGMILAALDNALNHRALVRRFHADPRVATVEALLHEQLPRSIRVAERWTEPAGAVAAVAPPRVQTWPAAPDEQRPQVQVLSNGRYRAVVARSGAGGSWWQGLALTPWQPDPTVEEQGGWIYLQDRRSGALWSATQAPVGGAASSYEVAFAPHRVEFLRREEGIFSRLAVAVAPAHDLEIRSLRLINESERTRQLAVTSYAEMVLAPEAEAARHPAFAKLFVDSAYLEEHGVLLCWRRTRAATDAPLVVGHTVIPGGAREWETDRARFLGRGRSVRRPVALESDTALAGLGGATLDPILALRRRLTLAPGEATELALLTAVGASRREVLDTLEEYRSLVRVRLAFEEARAFAESELGELGIDARTARWAQELLSAVLVPQAAVRAPAATLRANRRGPSGLWGHGLSGDLPILLARWASEEQRAGLQTLLEIHALWRRRGVEVDLVLLDETPQGYDWPVRDWLHRELDRLGTADSLHRSGGVFLLRQQELAADDRLLLEAAARSLVDLRTGDLEAALARQREGRAWLPQFVPVPSSPPGELAPPPLERPAALVLDNGLGGFTADGRDYVIFLEPGQETPAPWCNVVANPEFGFLVSESGGGTTWAGDSAENRLTPWRNDPVTDAPGEALFLRDEETGEVWSPTPRPAPAPAPYEIRHGAGRTVFRHRSHRLDQTLELFVPRASPVKIARLELRELGGRPRRITATFYAEWVLGGRRQQSFAHVVPDYAAAEGVLLARNPFNTAFGERVAFLAADRAPHGLTADRSEFLGRGDPARPQGLARVGLSGRSRPGVDPCAALQVHLDLPPGGATTVTFFLGQERDRAAALGLVRQLRRPGAIAAAWAEVEAFWDGLLETLVVSTPAPDLDLLVNRWLLVQTLGCRLWGRSGPYQSSGAFGFRDQLQDACALLRVAPDLARDHLLEAARRQFREGDVLHWWHPGTTRGVRTRCSDDLLWLPWAVTEYLEATGDASLLTTALPFLDTPPLDPGESHRYAEFSPGPSQASLYEHCCRALERGATRGPRGLPLIGSGDWNDGLDRVGLEGRGESVWLAWFLCAVLDRFAPLCEAQGEKGRAEGLRRRAAAYRAAIEEAGWDGEWYRRAFYDDGTPLGSATSREAAIDLVAQAWAVLADGAGPARGGQAMDAAFARLGRPAERLLALLAPPFDRTQRDPGYIKGYPPGVRENGGQYNHAALWAAAAAAALGDGERAVELARWVSPAWRSAERGSAERYALEPYAVAGDIRTLGPHAGRGGWSWYTGSSGWLYRLMVETILGLEIGPGTLRLHPCLPPAWPGFSARLRRGRSVYHVEVRNPRAAGRGVAEVLLDGESVADGVVPLLDDGRTHQVVAWLEPGASAPASREG